MYVNIIIYSSKLLLFVWSTLKKEKKNKKKKKKNNSNNNNKRCWKLKTFDMSSFSIQTSCTHCLCSHIFFSCSRHKQLNGDLKSIILMMLPIDEQIAPLLIGEVNSIMKALFTNWLLSLGVGRALQLFCGQSLNLR